MKRWILLISILGFLVVCGTSVTPDAVSPSRTEVPGTIPAIGEAPIVTVAPPVMSGEVICTGAIEGSIYTLACNNQTQEFHTMYAVCYECPDVSCKEGEQTRYALSSRFLDSRGRRSISIGLPDCGWAQCDGALDHEPPAVYTPPVKIPGYVSSSGEIVNMGDCPEDPKCELTQDDCLFGPFIPALCECGVCPDDMRWDPDLGECIHPCFAECSEPWILNEDKCICECAIECDPPYMKDPAGCECMCDVNHPCPEGYHRHGDDCECYCDPVGEPDCPEQVWNELTCQWEGECPPDCCDLISEMQLPMSFYKRKPFGSPAAECKVAPTRVPGGFPMIVGEGGIKIRKGGKCYEITSECDDPALFTRTPKVCCQVPYWPEAPQYTRRKCYDESHVTECMCPLILQ